MLEPIFKNLFFSELSLNDSFPFLASFAASWQRCSIGAESSCAGRKGKAADDQQLKPGEEIMP